jgi:hypothetical protein
MGSGAGVGHAAGKRLTLTGRPVSGQVTPSASGYRGHPPGRVLIVWNVTIPLGVRAVVRCVVREDGGVSQRAKDDPTSQCRWPKGDRKPGPEAGTSAGGLG